MACDPADIPHKLQRSRANLFPRDRRIELERHLIFRHIGLRLQMGKLILTISEVDVTGEHSAQASVVAHPLKNLQRVGSLS
jgi:hypothetical protein